MHSSLGMDAFCLLETEVAYMNILETVIILIIAVMVMSKNQVI